ncbi:DUF4249 domain-containing protein [Flavobacterium sp. ANB]|uniref:DUF4249 domain-containing protein n=1 Tax=unclassified Flavobacterium TaxID=196869 RepID=UPI0012B89609|nr:MULTISPECIES: DUF4249 domain-containing protein [unclassified Flavobacterium]MBF4514911.1 DUF4249 domain-containing protein [Flavobacterium sp. ANB]MTD68237.1 DUF4249 family protein [Flavobacterium sp. LC2016-13]
MEFIIRHTKLLYKTFVLILFCLTVGSCTEQYVFQNSKTFESILVVQGNITNELKKQEIKITRTYRLEENGPAFEKGAIVYVTDSESNTYEFEIEDFSGLYVSKNPFQAVSGRSYQLNITTTDGKSYSSSSETLTTVNEINVEPKIETIDGNKGVQIVVSSNDPSAKSRFYRYEYEETYKIVSPYWSPNKLIVDPNDLSQMPNFLRVPRDKETRVCYSTKKSDDIILLNTVGLSEDRINLPIRFIDIKNPIISERYSILVRQYVQNLESYTFYKTLKSLSTSTSLFSQVQPGFNYGNLKSTDDPNEKIVGYFEVSSISSKRIFFNFRDIFIDDPNFPPFFVDCTPVELANCWVQYCSGYTILALVRSSNPSFVYYSDRDNLATIIFVPPPCGDCTSISSNIKPLFWID